MANEARVTFEGRMGADFDLRFLPSGDAVANANVAVTQRIKDGDSWKDGVTSWFRVGLFGKAAENAVESIKKGDLVHVSGILVVREWEKDGKKGTSLDVRADFVAPSIRYRVIPHSDGPSMAKAAAPAEDAWTTPAGGYTEQPPF